jgi:hypothetical protein
MLYTIDYELPESFVDGTVGHLPREYLAFLAIRELGRYATAGLQ